MDYISNHPPPVSIEKPFSKTHAPVFGIGVLERFYSSRIHINPKQTPPKTGLRNLQQRVGLQRITMDLDCVH